MAWTATHKIPGLKELAILKHGPRYWYVLDVETGNTLGLPCDTLTEAIAYGLYRAELGGYR